MRRSVALRVIVHRREESDDEAKNDGAHNWRQTVGLKFLEMIANQNIINLTMAACINLFFGFCLSGGNPIEPKNPLSTIPSKIVMAFEMRN